MLNGPCHKTYKTLLESYTLEPYRAGSGWSLQSINYHLTEGSSIGLGPDFPSRYEEGIARRGKEWFANIYGAHLFAFLTTEHRLRLVTESDSLANERQRAHLLHMVYVGGKLLENKIRDLVKKAFGKDIVLDYSVPRRLQFRVGDDFSLIPSDPREAMPILSRYEKLDDQGDGIRSFIGIVVALLSVNRSLFLIDEPEAFLHPPQAFRIGEFLAEQSSAARQIVLVTHSADVLRGILARTQKISILRLDRVGDHNHFCVLDPRRVTELVTDPLLSSARVLDGLFYSGVVVVESDSDARFFQMVSKKLKPNADLHFVNADNKQTVPKIAQLYREMGVRCAGIVDFDVLNDRSEFLKQLESFGLERDEITKALDIRQKVADAAAESPPEKKLGYVKREISKLLSDLATQQDQVFDSDDKALTAKAKSLRQVENKLRELAESTKNWRTLKEKGAVALSGTTQQEFQVLWQICAAKGLFINPCGELESMLTEYGIQYTTDKRAWIVRALRLVPALEINDQKPPWQFINAIHEHIAMT